MRSTYSIRISAFIVLLGILLLSGCSTLPKTGPHTEPAMRQYEDLVPQDKKMSVMVYDPIEGFNRGVYRFNHYFDRFIFLPVVKTYSFIMPDYAEDRVSNFVDNVFEFNNFTNNLLQLKFKRTGTTLARFGVNTTVGIVGLWDPATGWGLAPEGRRFRPDPGPLWNWSWPIYRAAYPGSL